MKELRGRSSCETKHKEIEERVSIQIAGLQQRAQGAEASIQEHAKMGGDQEGLLQHMKLQEGKISEYMDKS